MLMRIWDITFTVSNLEQAVDFYENILGLAKKYHYPNNYAGFDCGGVEIGLVPGVPPETQEGMPCIDFTVEDVDASFRTLNERGVTFVNQPHDTAWGGRIALFADPDGNLMQLVQIDWRKYFSASAKA
jgi:catechol 2,3-dioxygenase-like lactoylglutathione lyase family enzyme